MPDYEAIRKDIYERFHDAIQKLYVSELKDQIADKDELITAQDHMIADQQDKVKRLEAALREIGNPPNHFTINDAMAVARAALGEERT